MPPCPYRKSPTSSTVRKDSDEENSPVLPAVGSSKSPCSDRTNNGLASPVGVPGREANGTAQGKQLSNSSEFGSEKVAVTPIDIDDDDDSPLTSRSPQEGQDNGRVHPAKPQRRSAANNVAVRLNQAKREEKLISHELKKRASGGDTANGGEEPPSREFADSKKMRMDEGEMLAHEDNDGKTNCRDCVNVAVMSYRSALRFR